MSYHAEYERAIKYEADHATVDRLLSPAHLDDHTRWGLHPEAELRRGIAADALSDHGRESEAALLRSPGHVVLHEGEVKPGEWVTHHLDTSVRRVNWERNSPGGYWMQHEGPDTVKLMHDTGYAGELPYPLATAHPSTAPAAFATALDHSLAEEGHPPDHISRQIARQLARHPVPEIHASPPVTKFDVDEVKEE